MPETKRPLKVFLCHARADKQKVRELYRYLRKRGIQPWLDAEDLVAGQDWRVEIPKAIRASDAIIICLSKNSINKEGFVQTEIAFALEKALEIPPGRIFIIPARFEDCEVPDSLERFQWVDLFEEGGFRRLMKSLRMRASQLERASVQVPESDEPSPNLTSVAETEHNAIAKAAREKEEREAIERAEREKTEKAAREPLEHETAERAMFEKAKRDAVEKAKRERAERRTAQIAVLRESFSKSFNSLKLAIPKAKSFFRIGVIVGIILVLFWVGLVIISNFILLLPTSTTRVPTTQISSTNSPVSPTKTLIPPPTPLLTEITDAKGVSMALVPAGDFIMGSNIGELDEQPPHTVYVDGFYIDKYEVTNSLYKLCVDIGVCNLPTELSSKTNSVYYGNPKYDNYPVIYVNWKMAKAYCQWRDAMLPTEAQWEKAARGRDGSTNYPWGNNIDTTYANYNQNIGDVTAVGSYEKGKSPYDVYDMAGNVWEWVADWYSNSYYSFYLQNSLVSSNPLGPASGSLRVLRGGSWINNDTSVRSYYRGFFDPIEANYNIGFRCTRGIN